MIRLRDDPNKQFNEARSAAVFAEDANLNVKFKLLTLQGKKMANE